MSNQNHDHHSSHLGSGFFLGVIVGAAIVFLFATKKGKKILKLIAEEKLGDFTELMEDDEIEETDEVPEEPIISTTGETEVQNGQDSNGKAKKKRFFKRVK